MEFIWFFINYLYEGGMEKMDLYKKEYENGFSERFVVIIKLIVCKVF